jgi:hypothetical protein
MRNYWEPLCKRSREPPASSGEASEYYVRAKPANCWTLPHDQSRSAAAAAAAAAATDGSLPLRRPASRRCAGNAPNWSGVAHQRARETARADLRPTSRLHEPTLSTRSSRTFLRNAGKSRVCERANKRERERERERERDARLSWMINASVAKDGADLRRAAPGSDRT